MTTFPESNWPDGVDYFKSNAIGSSSLRRFAESPSGFKQLIDARARLKAAGVSERSKPFTKGQKAARTAARQLGLSTLGKAPEAPPAHAYDLAVVKANSYKPYYAHGCAVDYELTGEPLREGVSDTVKGEAKGIAARIRATPEGAGIFAPGNAFQVSLMAKIFGVWWRCRYDSLFSESGDPAAGELKVWSQVPRRPGSLRRAIVDRGADLQMGLYRIIAQEVWGVELAWWWCFALMPIPVRVACVKAPSDMMTEAEDKTLSHMRRLAESLKSGIFNDPTEWSEL